MHGECTGKTAYNSNYSCGELGAKYELFFSESIHGH